jgi:hypothetical protein
MKVTDNMNTFIKITLAALICFNLCSCTATVAISETAAVAAIVKTDGLWLYNLSDISDKVKVDSNNSITLPELSSDGKKMAYTKNNELYFWQKGNVPIKIAGNIVSYCWQSNYNICFSVYSGGLYSFNIESKKQIEYISGQEYYDNIKADKNGKLYGEKYILKSDGIVYSDGIISYNTTTSKTSLIIKGVSQDLKSNKLGWSPEILNISYDGDCLYIIQYPNSASLAADGVSLIQYNTINDKISECSGITILDYNDIISQNPADVSTFAVINGEDREMNTNKILGIFNVKNQAFDKLSAEGLVAMTPSYSKSGKTILFSASPENINSTDDWMKQGNQHIYSIDAVTKKTTCLTNETKYFDFAPFYIGNGTDIGFFRFEGENNSLSLWKLVNGKEQMITDNIDINDCGNYYGHIFLEDAVNILGYN